MPTSKPASNPASKPSQQASQPASQPAQPASQPASQPPSPRGTRGNGTRGIRTKNLSHHEADALSIRPYRQLPFGDQLPNTFKIPAGFTSPCLLAFCFLLARAGPGAGQKETKGQKAKRSKTSCDFECIWQLSPNGSCQCGLMDKASAS